MTSVIDEVGELIFLRISRYYLNMFFSPRNRIYTTARAYVLLKLAVRETET